MKRFLNWPAAGAIACAVAVGSGTTIARADAIFPNFITPAFVGLPNTTYQEWNGFSTATGTNPATSLTNPTGAPWAFDSTSASDGAFPVGTHIYSFSDPISPALVIPNFGNGAGWQTTIVFQIETLGSEIDLTSVKLTPQSGSAILPTSTTLLDQTVSSTEFGDSDNDDYEFTWNVPGNATNYAINLTAADASMSWAGSRVDTVTMPAPEPASLALLGGCAGMLLLRRRRA